MPLYFSHDIKYMYPLFSGEGEAAEDGSSVTHEYLLEARNRPHAEGDFRCPANTDGSQACH